MNASFGNPWKVYICLFSFSFTSLAALGASFETFRSNWEEELVAKPAGGRSKVLNSFPESRHCQVGHLTILDLEPPGIPRKQRAPQQPLSLADDEASDTEPEGGTRCT